MADFTPILPVTLQFEGDFSNDKRDPGNWTGGKVGFGVLKGTKKGIAASAHPGLDIENLTDAQIEKIYNEDYFIPIKGPSLNQGIGMVGFDYAVNSGVGKAKNAIAAVAPMDPVSGVKAICARRLSFLETLKTWVTFGKGWAARVHQVEAIGIKWAAAPGTAREELNKAADEAHAKSIKHMGTATISAASGPAAGTQIHNLSTFITLGVILCGSALVFFLLARRQAERADILSAAAKGA